MGASTAALNDDALIDEQNMIFDARRVGGILEYLNRALVEQPQFQMVNNQGAQPVRRGFRFIAFDGVVGRRVG